MLREKKKSKGRGEGYYERDRGFSIRQGENGSRENGWMK